MKHILSRSMQQRAKTSLSPDLQIARVFEVFRKVLVAFWQEERAAWIIPVSFREGVLKVETRSPAAKQQFQLDIIRIKNEMNRQLGGSIVAQITIHAKGF